jgi:hypothetical protein
LIPKRRKPISQLTPLFFEKNFKIACIIIAKDGYRVQFFWGIQNVLHGYLRDFDFGVEWDAGYVYGLRATKTENPFLWTQIRVEKRTI